MGFWSKTNSAPIVEAAPSFSVRMYLDGTPATAASFNFEPYWQNGGSPDPAPVVPNTWQQWDVDAGLFWPGTTINVSGACNFTNGAGGAPFYTLSQISTACPSATIVGISVYMGSFNPNWNTYVDLVTFDSDTWNFEPNAVNAVYNAMFNPLALNYASYGFEATSTSEIGDYVHLAGTNRALQTVSVTMSDWALKSSSANVTWCNANPSKCNAAGFKHPITVNIYNTSSLPNAGTPIATLTEEKFIPWRPEADPTCPDTGYGVGFGWRAGDNQCYNGYAFDLVFDMSGLNVVLPNDVVVGIAYNTQHYGSSPLGVDGPYNSLNVAAQGSATVGTDDNADNAFWDSTYSGRTPGFRHDVGGWAPFGTFPVKITALPVVRWVDPDSQAGPSSCSDTGSAFTTISAAVMAANPGDTINVCPGTYPVASTIPLNKNDLTITSAVPATRAKITTTPAAGNVFLVTANGVTLNNLEIEQTAHGTQQLIQFQGDNFTATNNLIYNAVPQPDWNASGITSRAFLGSPGADNANLTGNTIRHFRQPAYLDNATGGVIANNNVSGTRGWVVAQGAYSFTGNTWGEPQNQACDIALLSLVNPNDYPSRLAMSQANDNAFICAQYSGGENGRRIVYVDNTQSFNGSDNTPYLTIQAGIDGALVGGEVQVAAGNYPEDVSVHKTVKLTGAGAGSTTITGPIGGSGSTVQVSASGVEISGFTITRAVNPLNWDDSAMNSTGLSINGQALTGMLIHDNVFSGNRTGLDINNSNGHTVRNNVIDNNRTGMIFRNQTDNMSVVENFITNNWTVGVLFLDASSGTNSPVQRAQGGTFSNNSISGNWYGQIVDRQTGGSLPAPGANPKNFVGNWFGATPPTITTANSAEPGNAALRPIAFGGSSVPPGGQPDIAGPASANFVVSPYLNNGTDTDVETVLGRGTFGFQGNQSSVVASVSISGTVSPALDGVTVTLSGSMNAVAVTSGGGNYTFSGLLGNGNYLVTPSLAGYSFDPTSRSYTNVLANVTNANFTGLSGPSPRIVRVVNTYATPGQSVTVPIELVSQGDENGIGFSLNYNSSLIFNPVVTLGPDSTGSALLVNNTTAGQLGIALTRGGDNVFAAGTRHILNVTFNTNLNNVASTPVTFGNVPALKKVSNGNADPLPATFVDGLVIFAQGLESDVAGRFGGSGALEVTDITQVGRFYLNLDAVNPLFNEFQRADASPRATKGDGSIDVTDITQAGRYYLNLDTQVAVGGPFVQTVFPFAANARAAGLAADLASPAGGRAVRVVNVDSSPGSQVTVSVVLDAQGDESAVGFTLSYDPTILTLDTAPGAIALGSGFPGAFFASNSTTHPGRIGIGTTYFGVTVPAGVQEVVRIRFNVSPTAPAGLTPVGLPGAPPANNGVGDVTANLISSEFNGGFVNILGPTAAGATVSGQLLTPEGRPIRNGSVILTDQSGQPSKVRTNAFGYFRFEGVLVGQMYVLGATARGYDFTPITLNLQDDATAINLIAKPRK